MVGDKFHYSSIFKVKVTEVFKLYFSFFIKRFNRISLVVVI